MPKYTVDMCYRAEIIYTGTIQVTAKDEAEAEDKAITAAEKNGPLGWESNEDSGEYEVENIEEDEE